MIRVFAFLLAILPTVAFAGDIGPISDPSALGTISVSSVGSGGIVSIGSDTYTDILYWWRCEAVGHTSDDYPTSSTTWTLNSSAALNTDAVHVGTNGLDSPTSEDYASLAITNLPADHRLGVYFRATAWTNYTRVLRVFASWSDYWSLEFVGGDEFRLLTADGGTTRTSLVTSGNTHSTGTWYYVEVVYSSSTNTREIYINGSSVGSSAVTIGALPSSATIEVGNSNTISNDIYLDNFALSNSVTRDLDALKDETEVLRPISFIPFTPSIISRNRKVLISVKFVWCQVIVFILETIVVSNLNNELTTNKRVP